MVNEDKSEQYAVSPLEAEPGESSLTRLELSYLHAAGIDPRMLNQMDRSDVIHLLVMHPERIENPRIGDVAALLYRFGLLEEMLEGDVDDDSDDAEKKKKEQDRKEREDQMFNEEVKKMQASAPEDYSKEYPLPPYLLTNPPVEINPQLEREFWRTHLDFPEVARPMSELALEIAAINPGKLGIALDDDPTASPDKPDKTPEVERPAAKDETESSSSPKPSGGGWVAAVEEAPATSDSLEK